MKPGSRIRFVPMVLAAAVCLLGTLAGWYFTRRAADQDLKAQFDVIVTRAVLRLQGALDQPLALLRSAEAFHAASQEVGPEEWACYAEHIRSSPIHPRIVRMLHITQDGAPAGKLRVIDSRGVVEHVAGMQPLLRMADRTGRAQLAPAPEALRTSGEHAQYLLVSPLSAVRRWSLAGREPPTGWLAVVIDAWDVLETTFGTIGISVRVEVEDPQAADGAVFAGGAPVRSAALVEEIPVYIGGRQWHLRIVAGPDFVRRFGSAAPGHVLQGGIVVTLTVVSVLIVMHRSRESAVRLGQALADREALARRAQEATAAAAAAKERFLATMSHELRTPLTSILGHADVLQDPDLPAEQRTQSAGAVHRNGEHLLGMINQVLDLSKVRSGKMRLESRACSIAAIVDDVVATLKLSAEAKGLTITTRHAPDLPAQASTDPLRIRQILMNVIGNAVKFSERGGVEVTTHAEVSGGAARVSVAVRDSGIGIAPESLEQIFEPFRQADSSTARRYGGTGLGLPTSRELARLLGGDLRVVSEPGRGSTFTLSFPAPVVGAGAEGPGREEPAHSSALNGEILIVDDCGDNRNLLAYWLRGLGARVQTAGGGREGLDFLAGRPGWRGVVLLDMEMPELDGYETARELRRRGYTVPVIAVTANTIAGERERCVAAGCDEYLSKPLNRALLARACAGWLGRGGEREAA